MGYDGDPGHKFSQVQASCNIVAPNFTTNSPIDSDVLLASDNGRGSTLEGVRN